MQQRGEDGLADMELLANGANIAGATSSTGSLCRLRNTSTASSQPIPRAFWARRRPLFAAISRPAPMHAPWSCATTGKGSARIAAQTLWIFSTNAYGRPEVVNTEGRDLSLSFNLSHTNSLIVMGVTRRRELG